MIPKSDIIAWSKNAPWKNNYLIEQDLIIERALVEIYSNSELREHLAFRGGTAIHKLYFYPQPRYSEDIDLVQISAGPIGDILTLLREKLSFLGTARYERAEHSNKLIYRVDTEFEPVTKLRLKIEINTREHFTNYGYNEFNRKIESTWFTGVCKVKTFTIEELLGTKLRAMYQRSKGRDLFDLWYANDKTILDVGKIIESFRLYMKNENHTVTREEYIANMELKNLDKEFHGDIVGLIRPNIEYDGVKAWPTIKELIIDKL
jgi:predicted nucleotidyltransferase component of viral defense system